MYKNADRGNRAVRLGGLLAMALAALAAGCAPDYMTQNAASVNLIIASINGGAQLDSDVRNGEFRTFVCEDEVAVAVAVRNKNPNAPAPNVPSQRGSGANSAQSVLARRFIWNILLYTFRHQVLHRPGAATG